MRAEAQDSGNLPIRLPERDQPQALDLATTQPWPRRRRLERTKTPCGAQRMRTDGARSVQMDRVDALYQQLLASQ